MKLTRRRARALIEGVQTGVVKPDLATLMEILAFATCDARDETRALEKRIEDLERRIEPPARTNRPKLTVIDPGTL